MKDSSNNIKIYPYARYLILLSIFGVFLSALFLSSTFARYSDGSSGFDNTRVAVWNVDASDESSAASMPQDASIDKVVTADASSAHYTIYVSNASDNVPTETSVAYHIIVVLPSDMPGVNLTINDGDNVIQPSSISGNTYIFTCDQSWFFQPAQEQSSAFILNFNMTEDASASVYKNIKVYVDFQQKQ